MAIEEKVILSHLVYNEEYVRKTIPFIKEEYFQDHIEKTVFKIARDYILKYNSSPTKESLLIDVKNLTNVSEDQFKEAVSLVQELKIEKDTKTEFLVERTEEWCKDRAIYLAIMESIGIIDNKNGKLDKAAIPQILSDAIAVSFDTSIGHNYIRDSDERYASYHDQIEKIPFDLAMFNKVTCGGVEKKTLNSLISGTGVGKSLILCHFATSYYASGKNVLYITLELSEKKVGERIDTNLLNVTIDELKTIPKDVFDKKIARVKSKIPSRLIIKEFPTAGAGSANFRHLLNELKIKENFVPDIIIIDHLSNCSSSRLKRSTSNSFEYLKSVAEELRGLAMEFDVPIWTAVQTNRGGSENSDPSMTDTAESFGIPQTLDFYAAIIVDETLYRLGQLMIKQLKSRYNDINQNLRFVIGVDRTKFRLYDAEQSAQETIINDIPVMDNTDFGSDGKNKQFQSFFD